jgi:T3SS (YopN, CesT) and YbjN peptide-binding chaperone 1
MGGREVEWLRAHVHQCFEEIWDVPRVRADEDGDIPFRTGAAGGWISVVDGDPLLVRVWAHAAYGVKATAAVLREINDFNRRTKTSYVFWADGVIVVEQTLHADGADVATLGQAWQSVSCVANDLGPLLAAVHGGATPFPAEEEPASDSEPG